MDQVSSLASQTRKQDMALWSTQAVPGNSSQHSVGPRDASHNLYEFNGCSGLDILKCCPLSGRPFHSLLRLPSHSPLANQTEQFKKMQRSKQAMTVASYNRLKEPHLNLCKSRNMLLWCGATMLPIAALLATLLRPGHTPLAVPLLAGHEKDGMSRRE